MTITKWLEGAKEQILALDAELIAVKFFAPEGTDRSWLVAHGDELVGENAQKRADEALERREQGEPLAYIFGKKEFYGRDFMVDKRVLIPRPETEMLIDLVKELPGAEEARILEVGTGSGCMAATLALELPRAKVFATDVSTDALGVAERNIRGLGAKVGLYQADLLEKAVEWPSGDEVRLSRGGLRASGDEVRCDDGYGLNGLERAENGLLGQNVEILVANLPYVDKDWAWLEEKGLDYEPSSALYAEKRGLALYERLFMQLKGLPIRYAVIEADPCQHEELIGMAERAGLAHLKTEGFGVVFKRFSVLTV